MHKARSFPRSPAKNTGYFHICTNVELKGRTCCWAGVPSVRKKGLPVSRLREGDDPPNCTLDVIGLIVGGRDFSTYGGFRLPPELLEVTARQSFQKLPIPYFAARGRPGSSREQTPVQSSRWLRPALGTPLHRRLNETNQVRGQEKDKTNLEPREEAKQMREGG